MANISRLSSIAGLAVAGAALGLYLGSSAISEINPAYYSTPFSGSAFHADLVPNAPDQSGSHPLPELEQVAADIGKGCVLCGTAPEDSGAVEYASMDSRGVTQSSDRADPADIVLAEADRHVSRGLSAAELRDIERYAHFRVTADEDWPNLAAAQSGSEADSGCTASDGCQGEAAPGI